MDKLISMATLSHEVVDCRMLQLEIEFHQLNNAQLKNVARFCFEKTLKLFQNIFYVDWSLGSRRVRVDKVQETLHKDSDIYDFGFCGDVLSKIVFNSKSYREYDRKLRYENDVEWSKQSISVDYPPFFSQLFSPYCSPEQVKQSILSIFNEPNKKMLALWRNHDMSGRLFTCPYSNYPDMFYGQYRVLVAAACFSPSQLVLFSEKLARFALQFSQIIPGASARVALSPIKLPAPCSGHMEYFGGKYLGTNDHHIQHSFTNKEWSFYNYSGGAEWFNILSAKQCSHIPNFQHRCKTYSDVKVEKLGEENFAVQSNKNIFDTDVPEYLSIKKLLYEALYPGEGTMSFAHMMDPNKFGYMVKPRYRWELVPLLEHEILVFPDRIVFRHLTECPSSI